MYNAQLGDVFFRSIAQSLFSGRLSQSVVDGINQIVTTWNTETVDPVYAERAGIDELAGVLATAVLETGHKMQPVRENLYYSSAGRIRAVWPTRFGSEAEAEPFVKNPKALACRVYNGRMGNREGTDDGWVFRGGGIGQVTGRDNHVKFGRILGVDLLTNPELMLEPMTSARALIRGFCLGLFTGHAAGDNDELIEISDRRAINGMDRANDYAFFADAFLRALRANDAATPEQIADKTPVTTEKPLTQSTELRAGGLGLTGIAGLTWVMDFFDWIGTTIDQQPIYGAIVLALIVLPIGGIVWSMRRRLIRRYLGGE